MNVVNHKVGKENLGNDCNLQMFVFRLETNHCSVIIAFSEVIYECGQVERENLGNECNLQMLAFRLETIQNELEIHFHFMWIST